MENGYEAGEGLKLSLRSLLILIAVNFLLSGAVEGSTFHNQAEALSLAFPRADRVEKKTHILNSEQVQAIEEKARSKVDRRVITIHEGWRGEEFLGYAHIDVHRVRTRSEAFLVVVDPQGQVTQVRILAFHEPLEYLPVPKWYALFQGKTREDDLRVGRDLDAVSGATLTTRATADGVRRMLAYHEVLLKN